MNLRIQSIMSISILACHCFLSAATTAASAISSGDAAAIAVNSVESIPEGFAVHHPHYAAQITKSSFSITPASTDHRWRWTLLSAGYDQATDEVSNLTPSTIQSGALLISIERATLREEYLLRADGIEQQFILLDPPTKNSGNFAIRAAIESDGEFKAEIDGWTWREAKSRVRMGLVTVFDAEHRIVPVCVTVDADYMNIVVSADDLSAASFPVTVDPMITASTVRLSDAGPDGDIDFDAQEPAVALNRIANEFLVVWAGDDNVTTQEGEFEIFGQRIDALTGAEVGANDFRISDMGPNLSRAYDASSPDVIFNPTSQEYLVVWSADDSGATITDDENEIFAQRLNASGVEVGTNDFRISDMGPDGNSLFDAARPAVAFNTTNNEYLIAWSGDDGITEGQKEIYAQRLDALGNQIGSNDFVVSDMGPIGDTAWRASVPDVAYSPMSNEYFVVWQGEDNRAGLVEGEFEIYGQRLAGASGTPIGVDDMRISDVGTDGVSTNDAAQPAVSYSAVADRFLVVWQADDVPTVMSGEIEIFGQFINATTGVEVGTNDFRISTMGTGGSSIYDAGSPAVGYDSVSNEFLIVWDGDTDDSPLVNDENEIFATRIQATTGLLVGTNSFRLSDMGTDGLNLFDATTPAIALGASKFLVVWEGDDDTASLADNELEIYGQFLQAGNENELGTNDFRISDMGIDGDINFDARVPVVAYNTVSNEYLVVWEGDDSTNVLVDGETEIFGQRIDGATGNEVGTNDFRISDMGPNGDTSFDATAPAVAHNPTTNEYLVVWEGEDGVVSGEFEIYGQFLNASGTEIGSNDFRLSDLGPNGDVLFDAESPEVSYGQLNNKFLVVWSGDDNTGLLVEGESEIFGQFIDGTTHAEVGSNDFRISDMGLDGNQLFDALTPDIAYNITSNEFLVTWSGEDSTLSQSEGEFEIFVQRINANLGTEAGTNDICISDMGVDFDPLHDATSPAVSWYPGDNSYFVVWAGDDAVDGETEIYCQKLDALGNHSGINDLRLSHAGSDGDPLFDADLPDISLRQTLGDYVVVWQADGNFGGMVNGEIEIFGQLVDALTGTETGASDFRVSVTNSDGSALFDALEPRVGTSSTGDTYFVVWAADNGTGGLGDNEFEIFGQLSSSAVCCVALSGNVDCDFGDSVDIADLTTLVDNLFITFQPLCCEAEANCDGIGGIDIADLTTLVDNLFISFSPTAACQ